ncbi:UNVERIFIED_CONTAM: hypothetical protein Slati_2430400 [Sesamum latifolium]|uniref:Uncharacterized protein n=1 Tax=Sesamum latifolium TaxID=2727402 RepID=A0AAW2WCN6_9LAMI
MKENRWYNNGIPPEKVPEEGVWLLHVDGSTTTQGSRIGIVMTSPQREDMEFAIIFEFKASNKEAEYESTRSRHEDGSRGWGSTPRGLLELPANS